MSSKINKRAKLSLRSTRFVRLAPDVDVCLAAANEAKDVKRHRRRLEGAGERLDMTAIVLLTNARAATPRN
jgi:hypothetical protein